MKNLKTSVAGAILAGLLVVQSFMDGEGFDIQKDWPKMLVAAGVAVLGFFADDPK